MINSCNDTGRSLDCLNATDIYCMASSPVGGPFFISFCVHAYSLASLESCHENCWTFSPENIEHELAQVQANECLKHNAKIEDLILIVLRRHARYISYRAEKAFVQRNSRSLHRQASPFLWTCDGKFLVQTTAIWLFIHSHRLVKAWSGELDCAAEKVPGGQA